MFVAKVIIKKRQKWFGHKLNIKLCKICIDKVTWRLK